MRCQEASRRRWHFFLVNDPDSDLWVMSSNRLASLCDCPHVTKVHGKEWVRQLYEISQGIDEKLQNQEIEVPKNGHTTTCIWAVEL